MSSVNWRQFRLGLNVLNTATQCECCVIWLYHITLSVKSTWWLLMAWRPFGRQVICSDHDDIGWPIRVTSQWPRWRIKSPASRLFTKSFIKTQIKESIKAPRHWPLCGEFTGDRWIPHTKGQQRGKCFHLMTTSCGAYQEYHKVMIAH